MVWIHRILLLLIAAVAAAVVLTRDPLRQTLVFSFFGMLLALLFLTFQAPDVAYSEIVIGSVGIPLMLLVTLVKVKK